MLPEVAALHRIGSLVRIPPSQDVPISDRVQRILDTAPMRRLASISQLGMVSLVYPGATHSRLEHSLGVYHNALRLLARFSSDDDFAQRISPSMTEAFVVAALIHDVGHWPFCHPIEDMGLSDLGEHESRIERCVVGSELADCVEQDWDCELSDVLALLDSDLECGESDPDARQFLASCLSGPIDIDKLDYLQRDSLHAGVPYGRNFDAGRLISALCFHPETSRLAIVDKGRTAAEMMVFSRYVMFSEVYWHHAVRSATAMLQRSVFLLQNRVDLESTLRMVDGPWIRTLRRAAEGSVAEPLVEGLFGARRQLYKRAAEFNLVDGQGVHQRLARRPYWWLVACSERLADQVSTRTGTAVHAADLLIDAPPVKLEVDINVDVIGRDGSSRPLGEVSPVASALAEQQFDNQVKQVRVFVRGDLRQSLSPIMQTKDWAEELVRAADSLEQELV
ncbi:MAG: HD domain-containing protein [Rubripirellula sp.]